MTKVAIFTTARSDMTFLTPLIKKMNKEAGIQLLLFVGGAHLQKEYGNTINEIKKLKIKITENFDYLFSGSSKKNISKSLSRAHKKIGKIFEKFSFDFVCVIGDRFENLAQISHAIVYNKPIIHIFGGERTEGVIDEQVRHMITKAAHLHFTMCEEYKKNVINMGEQRFRVHNCGSLSIDNIKSLKKKTKKNLFKKLKINYEKPVAILTYHPVTLEKKISTLKQIKNIFQAIKNYDMQFVITAPGHEHEREEINHFIKKKSKKSNKYIYIKSLGFENLFNLLPYCKFVIGNSSSGCIEVPYFKIPTINIGDRQKGRIFHKSLINCGYNTKEIKKSIDKALSPNFVKKIKKMKYKFSGGDASNKIVKIIKKIKLNEKFMNKRLIFN